MERLFVYGTLRPGIAPVEVQPLLKGLRHLATAWVPGRLHDLGAYPAAVLHVAADTRIHGDILELPNDAALLAALDAYEGLTQGEPAAGLFRRVRQDVTCSDGCQFACWIYVANQDLSHAPVIVGGDYAAWLRNRPRNDCVETDHTLPGDSCR